MCVYLIINLYVSIFIGSPKISTPTHTPAGETSENRSMHVNDEEDTAGVGGEVPHETGTLNAYIFFF